MKAQLARCIGVRREYVVLWGHCDQAARQSHCAVQPVAEDAELDILSAAAANWPARCVDCGAEYEWTEDYSKHLYGRSQPIYDRPDGKLAPGDLYWVEHSTDTCPAGWTNCDGKHLHGVLPNGHFWDIDSRATNCGSRSDRTHRCWVRHGEPPEVTVDKTGLTCVAGAGSIIGGDWHGFLRNGEWVLA